MHDKLSTRKIDIADDEDRRGILSKAKGQLARLAMIIHCLEQSVDLVMTQSSREWESEINESSVSKATVVMDYIIEQKFALMKPEIVNEIAISTGVETLDNYPNYLSKFLAFKGKDIMASDVS